MHEEDFIGDDFFIAPGEESLLDKSAKEPLAPHSKKQASANAVNSVVIPTSKDTVLVPTPSLVAPEVMTNKEPDNQSITLPVLDNADSNASLPSAQVEDVRSINFAQNLKEYRSPKLAMLLSFILPGAGQAYARSIVKTAIFGVAELGIVGASIAFWVQGNRKSDEYLDYADRHFDTEKFADYYNDLSDSLLAWSSNNPDEARKRLQTFYSLPHQNQNYVYIDTFRVWAAQRGRDFYNQIGDNQFVQGWIDAEPSLSQIVDGYRNVSANDTQLIVGQHVYPLEPQFIGDSAKDSSFLLWVPDPKRKDKQIIGQGYSHYQFTYNQMVSEARASYDKGQILLVMLLLNHIGSAMDAGLTAKRHNDELLGKQSLWRRLEFEQQWVCSGSHMAPGYAVRVTF
jgi:hypothetical protein